MSSGQRGGPEAAIANVFQKFSQKFVEQIRFRISSGRRGTSGKLRATRCQNSSLIRHVANPKTIRKKLDFFGYRKSVFRHFPGFWRESAFFSVKIIFLVKFCSRCTYSEVRATKNCEKAICAARTWPPRAT